LYKETLAVYSKNCTETRKQARK